jgi:hypothetical protein
LLGRVELRLEDFGRRGDVLVEVSKARDLVLSFKRLFYLYALDRDVFFITALLEVLWFWSLRGRASVLL